MKLTKTPPAPADGEIHADLVETLFETADALVIGILSGMLVPVLGWLSTGNGDYGVLVALLAIAGAYRLHVLWAHRRASIQERRAQAARWERRYAVGAISFMMLLGASVAIVFNFHHGETISYYALLIMTGVTGNLVSRNAAQPKIVFCQVAGACIPLAALLLTNFPPPFWGVSAYLFAGVLSIFRTTEFFHLYHEAALRNGADAMRQRQKFSIALNSMTHGLCMGDSSLTITVINRRIVEFFGIVAAATPIGLEALALAIARSGGMPAAEAAAFAARWKEHAVMRRANAFTHRIGARFFEFSCERAADGACVTVIEDVTEKEKARRDIERIAHFDELTGLPNRYQFHRSLTEDLARLQQEGLQAALLVIDLDRFKEVNDTLGHLIGDQLLVQVGQRLGACATGRHLVARMGGDEYCVLMRAAPDAPRTQEMADGVLAEMRRPFTVEGHRITIGASIGVAVAPRDADTPNALIKCSDIALYQAKAGARGGVAWYDPRMQEELARKREIEEDLREALAKNEFVVFYQPIVDSRLGAIVAMEALLRWRHPRRGLVPPGVFIPIAEEMGIILDIGAWVLRRACRDAAQWPERIRVAVNLAPLQFQQRGVVEEVAAILRETGLPPDRLELEITESAFISDSEDVEAKLAGIAALGARLVLDDFGTGYSSLSYLNRFPVNKVKIDRAFSTQALESEKTRAIIGAISTLARDLGLDLVAEGVETPAQLALMAGKNIFLIQGFLYSKPRPIEELAPLFDHWADAPKLDSAA